MVHGASATTRMSDTESTCRGGVTVRQTESPVQAAWQSLAMPEWDRLRGTDSSVDTRGTCKRIGSRLAGKLGEGSRDPTETLELKMALSQNGYGHTLSLCLSLSPSIPLHPVFMPLDASETESLLDSPVTRCITPQESVPGSFF